MSELLEKLHKQAWVDEEIYQMYRVWSACNRMFSTGCSLEDAIEPLGVTIEDFERHATTWPSLKF